MANVAHSTLTGADLHENKGAAAATDDYVATVTTGSTVWKKLTASNLTGTGNSFGAQLLHVREEQVAGTHGGTFSSGAWTKRTLNTSVTNEISSASLATSQISLPAGTYYIEAFAPTYNVGAHQVRLYNTTDAASTLVGRNEYSASNGTSASVYGRFTIAGTKVFELQHRCTVTGTTTGLGAAISWGTEVYSEVSIWKVA
jgi:hypothetical protein